MPYLDIPAAYRSEKQELLLFINTLLEPDNVKNLPRYDNKEFLELAKLILGEYIQRKKGYSFTIQRPEADHHARWMSKSIYIMKMDLLLHQLSDPHWQTKKKIHKRVSFRCFRLPESLIQCFFSPIRVSAASNDINLYKSLHSTEVQDRTNDKRKYPLLLQLY